MSTTRYARIVFLDGDDGDTAVDWLDDTTVAEVIARLAQWDTGEYHDVHDTPAAGTADEVQRRGDYLLSWNTGLGYIGLERVIEEVAA